MTVGPRQAEGGGGMEERLEGGTRWNQLETAQYVEGMLKPPSCALQAGYGQTPLRSCASASFPSPTIEDLGR